MIGVEHVFDASAIWRPGSRWGTAIYSNMMVFGADMAGRRLIPISRRGAARRRSELNGAAVEANLKAFEIGRWAFLHPEEGGRSHGGDIRDPTEKPLSIKEKIEYRFAHLSIYQSRRLANRYFKRQLDVITDPDIQGGRRERLSQAFGLQGRIRGRPAFAPRNAGQGGRGRLRRRSETDLSTLPRRSDPEQSRARWPPAETRLWRKGSLSGSCRFWRGSRVLRGTPFRSSSAIHGRSGACRTGA